MGKAWLWASPTEGELRGVLGEEEGEQRGILGEEGKQRGILGEEGGAQRVLGAQRVMGEEESRGSRPLQVAALKDQVGGAQIGTCI